MEYESHFWKASVDELKRGWFRNKNSNEYVCLICGKSFEKGNVYPDGNEFFIAKKAIKAHVNSEHKSMFDFFLEMGKVYTGLTEHQRELMSMFYQGMSDKEIVNKTDATSTSTIRNQRFVFKEKYKQAKIIVAMSELLEERREEIKMNGLPETCSNEELVDIHRTATMIDERYSITESEKEEVLKRYFDKDNHLIIKAFPAKEKKKIIIMQHIIKQFEPNKKYNEKEVNAIIKGFYEDIPTIRRYLVEYGFLDREKDGKAYWVKQ